MNSAGDFVFDNTIQFINPYVLNAVDPTRHDDRDQLPLRVAALVQPECGRHAQASLGGTEQLPMGACPTNPIGTRSRDRIRRRCSTGVPTPTLPTSERPEAPLSGNTGDLIRRYTIATANNPALSDFTVLTNYPGTTPRSIVLDPADDRTGYVLDQYNDVYRFVNGGTNACGLDEHHWRPLADRELRSRRCDLATSLRTIASCPPRPRAAFRSLSAERAECS